MSREESDWIAPTRPVALSSEWFLRYRYERGEITVEEFEHEIERVLRYWSSCQRR